MSFEIRPETLLLSKGPPSSACSQHSKLLRIAARMQAPSRRSTSLGFSRDIRVGTTTFSSEACWVSEACSMLGLRIAHTAYTFCMLPINCKNIKSKALLTLSPRPLANGISPFQAFLRIRAGSVSTSAAHAFPLMMMTSRLRLPRQHVFYHGVHCASLTCRSRIVCFICEDALRAVALSAANRSDCF